MTPTHLQEEAAGEAGTKLVCVAELVLVELQHTYWAHGDMHLKDACIFDAALFWLRQMPLCFSYIL